MSHQNQVDPFGRLFSAPGGRGLFMGNRRVLHDDQQRVVRETQLDRWIICLLSFKGRQRQIMTAGHYTELFFLDEATALAAGHRPCFECRRADATSFRTLAASADGRTFTSAPVLDAALTRERADDGGKRTHRVDVAELPTGAMVERDGAAWLVVRDHLRRWSVGGYLDTRPATGTADVLTPPTTVAALVAGYTPVLHPTADIV